MELGTIAAISPRMSRERLTVVMTGDRCLSACFVVRDVLSLRFQVKAHTQREALPTLTAVPVPKDSLGMGYGLLDVFHLKEGAQGQACQQSVHGMIKCTDS
jgi:hypothetical protein